MGHYLHAIVGTPDLLRPLAARFPGAFLVPLSEALVMVPLPGELVDAIDEATHDAPRGIGETGDPMHLSALEGLLLELSLNSTVAYIETEYFGGLGEQSAAAFRDGRRLFATTSTRPGPINAALRELGVRAEGGRDEFDVLGLGRFRSTADLVERRGA